MGTESTLRAAYEESIAAMSRSGAAVRNLQAIEALWQQVTDKLKHVDQLAIASPRELPLFYRYRDILICQSVYLYGMMDYARKGGKSRGSSLYTDAAGSKALVKLPESCRFVPDDGALSDQVQEVRWQNGQPVCAWRAVHPIPQEDDFFENVWRSYRENENVY